MRFLLLLVLFLSGCASYVNQQAAAINRGDLAAAEQLSIEGIRRGDEVGKSWFNLGVVHERRGNRDLAVRAFTMSARYGNAGAQQALTNYRTTVPAADLAQKPSNTDGVAAALDGFNRGYNGGINCTTMGFDDLKQTRCR